LINQKSIAVLPFHNTSNDLENQYFADGISEEIISALSRIEGLKVTARTSSFVYRDTRMDIRHIGNELGVSTVLEGSVRKSDNRIRIATQLIRTDTGFQIWSEKFDRELINIFDLQDEISLLIAERIRENFGHLMIKDKLVDARTGVTEAYNLYLKGRYYQLQWTNESIQEAQKAYKASIAADPAYPMAYLGLSQCFVHQAAWSNVDRLKGLYMAYSFIDRLGSDHEHLAEYHYTKGIFHLIGNWEFEKAQTHLSKALSINPNYSEAIEAQADLFNALGKFKESEKYIAKALELNPNSPNHRFIYALSLYFQYKYDLAVNQLKKALAIESTWQMALQLLAICYLFLNRKPDFSATLKELDEDARQGFRLLEDVMEGRKVVESIANESACFFPVKTYLLIYSGKLDEAADRFKEAIAARSGQYIGFKYDPLLTGLREHELFLKYSRHFEAGFMESEAEVWQTKDAELLTSEETREFSELLERIMTEEKVFLNPQLSLRQVADRIKLHPNKLSWLINKKIGRGFSEFVNHYRLEEFKRRSLDPSNKHMTLLGLAYDSGFNSKSVFNDFFKKTMGNTPKNWVKNNS
jgi:TolB-like protein/AraC-like DNA-binding protein